MGSILAILPMIQSALSVIGTFNGNAKVAKTTGYMQDAIGVVTSLTPLVQQFTEGKEITPEDVKAALEGKDKALAEFDRLIAAKGG